MPHLFLPPQFDLARQPAVRRYQYPNLKRRPRRQKNYRRQDDGNSSDESPRIVLPPPPPRPSESVTADPGSKTQISTSTTSKVSPSTTAAAPSTSTTGPSTTAAVPDSLPSASPPSTNNSVALSSSLVKILAILFGLLALLLLGVVGYLKRNYIRSKLQRPSHPWWRRKAVDDRTIASFEPKEHTGSLYSLFYNNRAGGQSMITLPSFHMPSRAPSMSSPGRSPGMRGFPRHFRSGSPIPPVPPLPPPKPYSASLRSNAPLPPIPSYIEGGREQQVFPSRPSLPSSFDIGTEWDVLSSPGSLPSSFEIGPEWDAFSLRPSFISSSEGGKEWPDTLPPLPLRISSRRGSGNQAV